MMMMMMMMLVVMIMTMTLVMLPDVKIAECKRACFEIFKPRLFLFPMDFFVTMSLALASQHKSLAW